MFKVGDKVALVDTPDQLWGTVVRVDSRNDLADIEFTDPDGRKWFALRRASDGHVISGTWKSMQVVPYIDPTPPAPKYVVRDDAGKCYYSGNELVVNENEAAVKKGSATLDGSSSIDLLRGDAIYKLVGRIEVKTVTEEDVPVTPGYRYEIDDWGAKTEAEVIAIRGDYAFIQQFKGGVAQGCTTIRVSNIPKTKRPCNKIVKQLTKE